jgi:type VI secretion system protein ImpH
MSASLELRASVDEAGWVPSPADTSVHEAGSAAPPQPEHARRFAAWLAQVSERPEAYDLWQLLRHIEAAHPHLPRFGEAVRPADEPLRVGQRAELDFPPTPLSSVDVPAGGGPVRVAQRVFGLLGPNGPLPLHLTELVRERNLHHADATLQAFLDTITHRFALLFYRSWAQAQPVVALDRPGNSALHRWAGALFGLGDERLQNRDACGDGAKLLFAGRLSRQVRDADGLLAWCKARFDVPISVQQWCGHWMALERGERTRLRGRAAQALGGGAVLGGTVWDVQHKFRIVIGPLRLPAYLAFLPGGPQLARLQAMVRQWVGLEFAWDVQLILARADVPALRLGGRGSGPRPGALGRAAWLGHYTAHGDADALVIDVERTLHSRRHVTSPSNNTDPESST